MDDAFCYVFSQWIFHEKVFMLSQTMWYGSLRPRTEGKRECWHALSFWRIFYKQHFPDATSNLDVCRIHSNNCTREQRGATLPTNMLNSLDSLCHSHPNSWDRIRNHWWLNRMGQRPISSPTCFLCLTECLSLRLQNTQYSSRSSLTKDSHASVSGRDRKLYLPFYSYMLLTAFLP